MIDCLGRFSYQDLLVRAARISLCSGRKQETWKQGIYHSMIIPWHISSESLELLPQTSSVRGDEGGRLSRLGRLGNDGPEWLSDMLVSLFASAGEPLLGQNLDSFPSTLPSTASQRQKFIWLWICLVRRVRRITAATGCCKLPCARSCVEGLTCYLIYSSQMMPCSKRMWWSLFYRGNNGVYEQLNDLTIWNFSLWLQNSLNTCCGFLG